MTRRAGLAMPAYLLGGLLGLAGSLATGDPTSALIGAPLLALASLGAFTGSDAEAVLDISGFPDTAVEGDVMKVAVAIRASTLGRSVLSLGLPPTMRVVSVDGGRHLRGDLVGIRPFRGAHFAEIGVRCERWGKWSVRVPTLRTTGALAGYETVQTGSRAHTVIVLPSPVELRRLIAPLETNLHAGDLVSGLRGFGLEFSDIRPFRPGDDPRSLNWRVSTRLGDLWVNERHPERNGDVLLLVDARYAQGAGSHGVIDRSIRMAAALLRAHARRRHRLGVITLDGLCRWISPGMGERHRRQLIEQLLSVVPGQVIWEAIERTLFRAARQPAMLLALTPLLDGELAGTLHFLRVAGVDVVVVEVDIDLDPGDDPAEILSLRLWRLDRDRLRDRLTSSGIPVATWSGVDPPEIPLDTIEGWRKAWRRVRV